MTDPIYKRNIPAIREEEQEALTQKTVLLCGCGGLGGFILEDMVRLGTGVTFAADGDVFEESNRNRQILSTAENTGRGKAAEAALRMQSVNPAVKVIPLPMRAEEKTLPRVEKALQDAADVSVPDLIIDALDSREDRLFLEALAEKWNVPLVHGAVQGWTFQAGVCMPGSRLLSRLYGAPAGSGQPDNNNLPNTDGQPGNVSLQNTVGQPGNVSLQNTVGQPDSNSQLDTAAEDAEKTCLVFTAQAAAAIEAAEALKLLLGRPSSLSGKIFVCDLLSGESFTMEP